MCHYLSLLLPWMRSCLTSLCYLPSPLLPGPLCFSVYYRRACVEHSHAKASGQLQGRANGDRRCTLAHEHRT